MEDINNSFVAGDATKSISNSRYGMRVIPILRRNSTMLLIITCISLWSLLTTVFISY